MSEKKSKLKAKKLSKGQATHLRRTKAAERKESLPVATKIP